MENKEKIGSKEYNETLEVLSYEEIVEILSKEDAQYKITFKEFTNYFGDGKTTQYVSVKNLSTNEWKNYLVADQEPDLIERKLDTALEKLPESKEAKRSYYDDGLLCQYWAMVGKNQVVYPPSVAQKLAKEFRESAKRQEEFEKAKQVEAKKEPKKKVLDILDSGEMPFRI